MLNRGKLVMMPGRTANFALSVIFSLIGFASAAAQTAAPTSISFPATAVNSTSAASVVTFTNTQATAITINSIAAPAPFQVQSTGCPLAPTTLGAGVNCSISLQYKPTETGYSSGALTVSYGAGSFANVALSGTATTGGATAVSPASLNFGSVLDGTTSSVGAVTFTNNGASAINVGTIAASGDFMVLSTTCGASLAAGAHCNVRVTFTPSASGTRLGTLSIPDSVDASPVAVSLIGVGLPPVSLTPSAFSFGSQALNTSSAAQTATLKNNSTAAVTVTPIGNPGNGYSVSSTTCGSSLASGASCKISLIFDPSSAGSASATLSVTTSQSATALTAALSGTGILGATATPSIVSFGNQAVGFTSPILTVTLTNHETSTALTGLSINVAGSGFARDPSTTCGTSLAAGASCKVALTVHPGATGPLTGTLNITDTQSANPPVVNLSATGTNPAQLVPVALAFGSVVQNTTSAAQTVTFRNNQPTAVNITNVLVGGPFALTSGASSPTTCPVSGGSVGSGASCVIGVVFQPTTTGSLSGQITISDSAGNSPQFTTLTGTGVKGAVASPAALSFGNVVVNQTSASQTITLRNNQTTSLTSISISVPAPYVKVPATTTCGTSLAAGSSCNISVALAPTAIGAIPTSNVTVTDSASNSPQTVALTGSGVSAVKLLPVTLNFATVVVNIASIADETLTNNQTTPLAITSISGLTGAFALDPSGTCPMSPLTVAPGASCTIAVRLTAPTTGSISGTMTVAMQGLSSQSLNMTAISVNPVILTPQVLTFPAQYLGTTSAAQVVKLTNEQTVALNISGAPITGTDAGDFAVTSGCPSAVPAGNHCNLSVTFSPQATGTRTATLEVMDDATGSPQMVTLTGSGNAPLLLSPKAITNYTSNVGSTSAYQTVTITNKNASVPVTFSNFQINGDFELTSNSCPASPTPLAGGASCAVTIEFNPTIGGTRDGQLQVYDSAATSPQAVNLSGNGTNPLTSSKSSLTYTSQLVGTVSPARTLILTNHESEPETFSLATTGDFTSNSTCSSGTIAANSTCTVSVTFVPSSTNPTLRTGSLTISDSAPGGSPIVVSLTGSATATNPAAAVAVVSPGAGAAGTNVNVVITGNGWTHFNSSSTISFVDTDSASYPVDITVNSVTAVSANQLNASLTLAGGSSVVYGARNITVTTPLSGGGTETAKLVQAFTIADPSNAHTITGVAPAFGTQGQTENVDVVASGTHFVEGTTFANFGDGIEVNNLTVVSATEVNANITISNTTPVGYRTITMMTGGEFAVSQLVNNNPIFQIGPNNATLVSVSSTSPVVTPASEPQNFAGPIYLTATGTHFLQSATTVSITGGVIVGDVLVTSPTTATAQVVVPANATIGVDNVTVATGGEIATLNNSFTVTGSTPALISIAPNSAAQGASTTVTITGNAYTAFNACPGGTITANFTGEISNGAVTVVSAHQVTVPISVNENASVGSITANLTCGSAGSATIFPFTFTVTPSSAQIISVVPNSVAQGAQVTLNVTGLNTDWIQGTTMSAFYPAGVPIPSVDEVIINSATSAQLAVAVPTSTPPGNYTFWMATGGQIVNATISVYANTPTLTMNPSNGLVPMSGTTSFTVNFTGQFTHWTQGTTLPVIAGQGVTLSNFTVNSPVSATGTITIAAGAATGLRLVTFTTGGEIDTTYFNVTSTPVGIYLVNPYHAPQNTTLNVGITGLNTHFVQGTTQVIFGGPQITVNTVTVTSPTQLTANISTSYLYNSVTTASPPGWQTVYVNTGAEQVTGGFAVDAPATPTILSVTPNSAAQGSTVNVTITGSLTNWVQGTSNLILGAGVTVSNLAITSPTTATATIAVLPTAPIGGNSVIMVTGSEYDSGQGFSVTPSAAYISNVAPNVSCVGNFIAYCGSGGGGSVPVVAQLQTVTLNVTGVGTHWLQGDTTITFGPGVVTDTLTVNSPTSATAQITVLSSAPVGFATATANTDGEVASMQQAIDIEEGSPTLLAISPQGAQQGATLNLNVLGRFTNWQQGVTVANFNQDITVNSVTIVDSETAVLNITVSPLAYVDTGSPCGHVLTITTGSEQVSTAPILDNFCVAQGAEEITGVNPAVGIQGSTESVTITGSATNFINGVSQVSFGDSNIQVGTVSVTSPTSITVPIAITTQSATGYKTVTVTTYGQVATQQFAFQVSPGVAQLVEAIPNQAEQGVQNLNVQLVGQYSHFSASSTATFGAGITVNSITYTSPTQIVANISIDPLSYTGSRNVTVTTPNVPCSDQPPVGTTFTNLQYAGCTPGNPNGTGSEIVNQYVFSIIPGPAIITGVAPNTGNEGQEVVMTITGANTHWAQNFTQFYIAGDGSDITVNDVIVNSPTSAMVDMTISPTANPGTRSVYMVTAGESLTDSGAFVVTGGVPVITYLSPNSAEIGTNQLEVTINGLYTTWTQSTTAQPNFGPGITVTSYTVDDATHISAVINVAADAQLGYRTVVVQTGTQALTGNFLVTGPPPPPTPYIWYEYPTTGIPGQTLTINWSGINTEWNPNPVSGTQLTGWNSAITVNSFQVTSANTATANITISPTATQSTSTLTFTTPNTATYGTEVDVSQFTVVVAQPTLSIVDPGSGMQGGQGIQVNVIGQFTAFDNTTTFSFGGTNSGITVTNVKVNNPAEATVTLNIDPLANLGGYSVTATTPDATNPAQQVVGGAGFSVTPSLATIVSVSPNTAPQGTTNLTVNVVGQNTLWDGATTFSFGADIVVASTDVIDNTHATLVLSVPALAPEGTTGLTARTGGEVANLTQAFVITAGTPLLLSSGPGSVEQQGAAVFTVLSQATTWTNPADAPTVSTVSYGAGIIINSVTVTSDTSMTVGASVSPTTPVGYRNLTVTTGTQSLSIANAVYVAPGPAVVNDLSVSSGNQGQTYNLTINGINTHWLQGTTTLTFPNVAINTFTVTSPTTATANITVSQFAPAGLVNVTMTTLGEVATKVNAFQVIQTEPEMVFINSSTAMQGQTTTVTITALNTTFNGTTTATFGTGVTVNSVTPLSATQLQANITVQPTTALGYRIVTVTTGTQVVSSPSMFSVVAGPAAILSLNPASGSQGKSVSVVVTGSQTNFASGVTSASFGGGIQVTSITVTDLLHATVGINIPTTTPVGSYNVTLTTGGEVATILGGFSVNTGSASIASVNPPTGDQSQTLNVTINGQFTNFVNGTSVASFGPGITIHSTTVSNATTAVANITIGSTAALGSRTVTVTTGAEVASITGGFSVLAGVPAITSASPGSATAGGSANVVINGAFTNFQQGVTTVSFGSGVTVNLVTVSSATQLTASISVASNASTGARDITVTTNSQVETLNNGFTVLAGTPTITQINPNIGNPGQALSVNIYGQYTNWVNGTTTVNMGSSITVGSVTVTSPTTLTADITIGSTAATGPVDVTITTGGEVETVPGGFTIQAATIPPPSIISLSPGAYSGGIALNSNVVAVFSQPMNRTTITTSTVLLYLNSNPSEGNIVTPGTVTVDATGRVVTFTPTALLAPNSTYLVQFTTGIQDATGNTFPNYEVYLYTGSAANTSAPTVIAKNPPASSTVGTNVLPAVQFSTDMNQSTQAGLVLSTGGNPVAGTYSWNSSSSCNCGPGTIVTFTPSAPLAAGTVYKVSYGAPLADTSGNVITAGSYTFTTGSGPDTVQNYASTTFNGQTNMGTNFVPAVQYTKAINPIDINTSTLLLYDNDSGKYVHGTVTVAANGLSAKFTPQIALFPNTTYRLHQSSADYDADGNYLNGIDAYFTTGAGSDTTAPTVTSVSPANTATGVPLNAQIVVDFSAPINPNNTNVITVTPSGGSAINGIASLASNGSTLTFYPTDSLQPGTSYTVAVSGFTDLMGNNGTAFSSGFATSSSVAPIVVSTGLNASGQLMTISGTDAHWVYQATSGTPPQNATPSSSGTNLPLLVVSSGDTGFYSGWPVNGPQSSWININPSSTTGNTYGIYYTTFNLTGYSLNNLCLVGAMGVDDNGLLMVNGTPIMSNVSAINNMVPINLPLPAADLVAGVNQLVLGWGSTDNNEEAFRLQAVVQTCGASLTGGMAVTSSSPANGATNVPTSTGSISVTFNNPVDPLSVNATTLPVMVGFNSNQQIGGAYAVSGNTVTFTPDSPFPPDTQIYVGACGGPLDLSGDSAGNCYTQLVSFTTGPASTPAGSPFQVIAFTPANNATSVGLNSSVTATFNRSYSPGSINPNSSSSDFALFAGDGQSPWCTNYTRSQDNTTLSFNCGTLPSSSTMTAQLNSNLTDWAGDPLTNFTSQFTTTFYDSSSNGSIISVRPGSGASGVAATQPLILYSNLPINASTASNGLQVAQNNTLISGTAQVLDGGYTIVFTPTSPFTAGALIQWWTTGTLADATYNNPINGDSGYFFVAASTASLAPTVQVTSPAQYANPVPLNTFFDVQFNTPLNSSTVNSSNIYLYDGTTGLNVADTTSMPEPNIVRLVPTSALAANHYIYVYVKTGLQSTTSVPAVQTNWYVYTGTASDSTVPTVTNAVPYNGATNVGVNDTPGVVISKQIDPVSVTSNTFQVLNGATPLTGTYWFNSTNTRMEFVPNTPLPPSTTLTMSINGVLDQVGNPVTYTSHFQTAAGPDFTAPSIVWTSVGSNESMPINGSITVQFSESMDATSFSTSNFYLQDEVLNAKIPATITWSSDQSVAYLVPSSPLAAGRQYYFYCSQGTDLAGNQLNGEAYYVYAELTASTTPPTVIAFNPISGTSGLGTNTIIEAEFSAPIDPTSIAGVTLKAGSSVVPTTQVMGSGNTVVQLVPQTPLTAGTTYVMTVAGVKDPAGNVVATITNSFTTGGTYDIAAPSVVNYDPPYNATVGTNVIPKLIFNKPLNPITVSNSTFRMFLNDTGQFIPLTVALSANGLEVTLTPQLPLLPGTYYHYQACCGYQDMDGNNGTGTDLYFYTGTGAVSSGPTVTLSPASGATGIPLNASIQLSTSEPIDVTSWNQNSVRLLNGSTPVPGALTQNTSQSFTFVPSAATSSPAGTLIGCYNDSNYRVLNGYSWSSNEMTVESCVASCNSRGYVYAGAQDGSQCFCGNGPYFSAGVGNSCNMACTGNSAETCGGNLANDVYTAQNEPIPANLIANTTYTVDVSGLKDDSGNVMTPLSSSFTTGATASAPGLTFVTSNIPTAGTTGIPNNQQLVLTFSQILDPASVNSSTLEVMNTWNSNEGIAGTYTVSGNQVTFTPLTPYPAGANITVGECGGPTDVLGEVFYQGSCWQQELMNFYVAGTADTTAPTVVSVNPVNGATNVPHDISVSITFSKSMNPGTGGNNNTELFAGQDPQDIGSVNWSTDHTTMTFNVGALYNGTTYTIVLPTGGLTDMSGNGLANTFTSTFTTDTNPATGNGSVLGTSPGNNATGVPTNTLLSLYLNRQVNSSTVAGNLNVTVNGVVWAGTAAATADGYEIQFTPTTAFPNGAVVQWFFSNVYDVNGDVFNSSGGTFYVAPAVNTSTEVPQIVAVSPAYSAANVPTNAYVDLEYNVPIEASSLSTSSVAFTNSGVTFTISQPAPNIVRLTPSSPLTASTTYAVCANTNVIGTNGVAAQSDCYAAYFTTGTGTDSTSGTVTIGPPNNSVNVGTNAYIRFLFSKPVDVTSFQLATIHITTGGGAIPGTWTYNYSNSNVLGANFSPTNPLNPTSVISVSMSGLKDYVGHTFAAASGSFTTGPAPDTTPASVTFDFNYGQTGISTNATFTCLYTEPMDPSSITPSGTYIYSYSTSAQVPFTYSFAPDMMSVTMTPNSALAANSEFNYTCNSAIDLTGNAQNNGGSDVFYTGSGPVSGGPTLLQVNPPNNTTNMALNTSHGPWSGTSLGLLFNEAVAQNSIGSITLTPQGGSPLPIATSLQDGNSIVVVQLPESLQPNTTYTYNITGLTDLNGNAITPVTSSFTTGTNVNWNTPNVSSFLPANGATGVVDTGATISVTFNEPMNPVLIDGAHIYLRTHNTQTTVPATFTISSDYKTVTLTPNAALSAATIYDLVTSSPNWYLTDYSGNAYSNTGVVSTFTTQ